LAVDQGPQRSWSPEILGLSFSDGIAAVFNLLINIFKTKTYEYFFNGANRDMFDAVLNMPGYVVRTRSHLQLRLVPGKGFSWHQELEAVLACLNRCSIRDQEGRRFVFCRDVISSK
jgi:hypothetical protein